jgi:hypothetical protein
LTAILTSPAQKYDAHHIPDPAQHYHQPSEHIMKNRIAFALLMGVVTTGVISFSLIYLNLGLGGRFLKTWLRSWGMAYFIVIPVILVIAPTLQRRLAELFISMEKPGAASRGGNASKQKVAFALIMGAITTGVISFAVILFNLGYSDDFVRLWARSWGFGYLIVIPALLIVAPRVQGLVDRVFSRSM